MPDGRSTMPPITRSSNVTEQLAEGLSLLDKGSICTPTGFRAGTTACGLKQSGSPDLVVLHSKLDCSAAAVFTRNLVKAAPLLVSQETLRSNANRMRAVVINAGIANACTGDEGLRAAHQTQQLAAAALGCEPSQVFVLSTGVIGVQLPMERVAAGISAAADKLSEAGGLDAATAIMTTDTVPKFAGLKLNLSRGQVRLGGIAKGSGMIHPDMATMLAVLTCDALIDAELLHSMLRVAVEQSFNRISVDGDTSTNDTVVIFANGASGVGISNPQDRQQLQMALITLCTILAKAVVADGEGASKFITLTISGGASEEQALSIARTIATSPLVKTAFAGSDPNWGRILAAAGRAGVPLDPSRLSLAIGRETQPELLLVEAGQPRDYDQQEAEGIFSAARIAVSLDLGLGEAEVRFWTTDLTHGYITINADYHT